MKSVLISIQPKWVEKIASGEKPIEVRKSRPKLETPFKCYIYCTNGTQLVDVRKEKIYLDVNKPFLLTNGKSNNVTCSTPPQVNRKVIGEFVCDKIYNLFPFAMGTGIELLDELVSPEMFCKESCLTEQEICDYIGEKDGYGWHISNLEIYDKPKELSEFYKSCPQYYSSYEEGICAEMCVWYDMRICKNFSLPITRPPQSWCYVESLGE